MFEGMEDYNFGGPKRKNYGCLILIGVSVLIFLLGVLIGWTI